MPATWWHVEHHALGQSAAVLEVGMSAPPRLLGIGTAAPDTAISSVQGLALAELVAPKLNGGKLDTLYSGSGITNRGTILSADEMRMRLLEPPGGHGGSTCERLKLFMDAAVDLGERSAKEAMDRASVTPAEVTHLVTVTCTGAQSPGVDHGIIARLGLSSDISRTNIGFMGCHGAMNGLSVATAFAAANPAAVVLVTCVEICSLHYLVGTEPWEHQVANAIFADGSSSVIISSEGDGPGICGFGSRIFPNTAELMQWKIGEHGFEMTLSRRVPSAIKRGVAGWADQWLGKMGCSRADIAGWALHPGGRDILEGARRGLELPESALEASRHVLETHGNMSSGTVLWVLEELINTGTTGPIVALAFGPGLVVEGMLLEV
jgi:predicted naringenin-chalcone synthase